MCEEKPPRIPPRLRSAPKIGQFYWCDFPEDAQLPEFWKTRPVIVISKNHKLHGVATIIPCTTTPQNDNRWAFHLKEGIDGNRASWAICDKPTTVAISRLTPDKDGIRRISKEDFQSVLSLLYEWLPQVAT